MKTNIIFGMLLFFLIGGCQQKILLIESNSAHYAQVFSDVKPKNFQVSVFVSYDSLSKWIDQRPDKTILESKSDQPFIGFPIQTSLAGQVKLSSNNSNHLLIRAPAIFEAKPNVAGFNAGVVRGKLDLNLGIDLQIEALNKFYVGNITYSYQWIEKPTVKVAGFSVNVGPVVDNLFKNKNNELNATIKASIEGLLQPTSLEKMLINNAKNIPWPEYTFPTSKVGFGIRKFELSSHGLNLEILLNTSVGFSTSEINKKKTVYYYLNKDQKSGRELPISCLLDWKLVNDYVTKFAQEKFKNQHVNISINGGSMEYLRAHVNGFKGPKSELMIDFIPVVFGEHMLGFRIIHQELKGLSFPNSLFKNHVIKRINRLATDFKFDLMKSSELINQFSGPLVMNNTNLTFDVMQWNESSLYVSGFLGADWKLIK